MGKYWHDILLVALLFFIMYPFECNPLLVLYLVKLKNMSIVTLLLRRTVLMTTSGNPIFNIYFVLFAFPFSPRCEINICLVPIWNKLPAFRSWLCWSSKGVLNLVWNKGTGTTNQQVSCHFCKETGHSYYLSILVSCQSMDALCIILLLLNSIILKKSTLTKALFHKYKTCFKLKVLKSLLCFSALYLCIITSVMYTASLLYLSK